MLIRGQPAGELPTKGISEEHSGDGAAGEEDPRRTGPGEFEVDHSLQQYKGRGRRLGPDPAGRRGPATAVARRSKGGRRR